jgi:hypothetical protein
MRCGHIGLDQLFPLIHVYGMGLDSFLVSLGEWTHGRKACFHLLKQVKPVKLVE